MPVRACVDQNRRPAYPYKLMSENAQQVACAARCILATFLGKIDGLQFSPLRVHIVAEKSAPSHAWLCNLARVEPLEAAIMNPRRFATVAGGLWPTWRRSGGGGSRAGGSGSVRRQENRPPPTPGAPAS